MTSKDDVEDEGDVVDWIFMISCVCCLFIIIILLYGSIQQGILPKEAAFCIICVLSFFIVVCIIYCSLSFTYSAGDKCISIFGCGDIGPCCEEDGRLLEPDLLAMGRCFTTEGDDTGKFKTNTVGLVKFCPLDPVGMASKEVDNAIKNIGDAFDNGIKNIGDAMDDVGDGIGDAIDGIGDSIFNDTSCEVNLPLSILGYPDDIQRGKGWGCWDWDGTGKWCYVSKKGYEENRTDGLKVSSETSNYWKRCGENDKKPKENNKYYKQVKENPPKPKVGYNAECSDEVVCKETSDEYPGYKLKCSGISNFSRPDYYEKDKWYCILDGESNASKQCPENMIRSKNPITCRDGVLKDFGQMCHGDIEQNDCKAPLVCNGTGTNTYCRPKEWNSFNDIENSDKCQELIKGVDYSKEKKNTPSYYDFKREDMCKNQYGEGCRLDSECLSGECSNGTCSGRKKPCSAYPDNSVSLYDGCCKDENCKGDNTYCDVNRGTCECRPGNDYIGCRHKVSNEFGCHRVSDCKKNMSSNEIAHAMHRGEP